MKQKVLITRPINDAQETANILRQKGYDVFCENFLTVHYHEIKIPDLNNFEGLIFTSRHAVRMLCQNTDQRDVPVFTVGDKTAEEASLNKFKDIKSAAGDVGDLVQLLNDNLKSVKPYLYARGRDVSAPLAEMLLGQDVNEIILYHTDKNDEISSDCLEMLQKHAFSHILFYSKRTAVAFAEVIEANPQKTALLDGLKEAKALCLGSSMVEYLSILPWQSIEVAQEPNQQALMALLPSADQ